MGMVAAEVGVGVGGVVESSVGDGTTGVGVESGVGAGVGVVVESSVGDGTTGVGVEDGLSGMEAVEFGSCGDGMGDGRFGEERQAV